MAVFLGDSLRLENGDLPASWRTEIIRQPVNEEVVAGLDHKLDDVLTPVELLAELQLGAGFQGFAAIIRREPDHECLAASHHLLPEVEDEDAEWALDRFHLAVAFSYQVEVGNSSEPLADPS